MCLLHSRRQRMAVRLGEQTGEGEWGCTRTQPCAWPPSGQGKGPPWPQSTQRLPEPAGQLWGTNDSYGSTSPLPATMARPTLRADSRGRVKAGTKSRLLPWPP